MIPIRLELRNFLPYRSPDPIRFEGIHLVCLTGANGAGKSSIFDAITWSLWGKARAKQDDDLVHLGQADMYVQLDFEQEGVNYRVIRRRSRGKTSRSALDIFTMQDNGELITITEPSIRQTQTKINAVLRLDYETFVHSAFLQQGKADAFTTKQPAQRKKILSDILGLEIWETYEERARDKAKEIAIELEAIRLRLQEIDEEIAREPQYQEELLQATQLYQEAQSALQEAEAALKEVAHAPIELQQLEDQQNDSQRRIKEHEHDLQVILGEIATYEAHIVSYQATLNRKEDIEAGYLALQQARETDAELGEKLRQMRDLDEQVHQLEKQFQAARSTLVQQKSGYEAQLKEFQRTLDESDAEKIYAVQTEIAELEQLDVEREQLDAQIQEQSNYHATLEANLQTLKNEGITLNERIDKLSDTKEAICPLCGQALDDEHREQLISQLADERDKKRKHYRENQADSNTLLTEIKAQQKQSKDMALKLKKIAPLRERAGALQSQFEQANDVSERFTQVEADLQALEQQIEAETFAPEIQSQLNVLDQQRQALGYDSDAHDEVTNQQEKYRQYEKEYTQLQIAQETLPNQQSSLDNAQKRQERFQNALTKEQETFDQRQGEIKELEILVDEEKKRQTAVATQRTLANSAQERLISAQQQLNALEEKRKRKETLQGRLHDKLYEEGLYKELRQAFSKNGVPAMIIETAIPELEVIANDLLTRMTNGRMNLRLMTQREKSSGGIAETLDIEIADELGTRNYELYSGGEAFRINFAIRVALSKMLARRAGAQLRTLFIDEGFGTQDEDGRNKLIDAITAIQDDFNLIMVITHIDELRDSFPVHLAIEKTANGSMVNIL